MGFESFKRFVTGALGAGVLSAEAVAKEPVHHEPTHESAESGDVTWASAARRAFDAHVAAGDIEAAQRDYQAFVREYYFPTQGKIEQIVGPADLKIVQRVASDSAWLAIEQVAQHMLEKDGDWNPNNGFDEQLLDIVAKCQRHRAH